LLDLAKRVKAKKQMAHAAFVLRVHSF